MNSFAKTRRARFRRPETPVLNQRPSEKFDFQTALSFCTVTPLQAANRTY
ncbi:hypothetical protein [Neisseria sp. CCUG12390]